MIISSIAVFFTATPFGRWLRNKAFVIVGLFLVICILLAVYANTVNRVQTIERERITAEQLAKEIESLKEDIERLKKSNEVTQTTLQSLHDAKQVLADKVIVRNAEVAKKVQAIARSNEPAADKAVATSLVYATSLTQAYCVMRPEECPVITDKEVK